MPTLVTRLRQQYVQTYKENKRTVTLSFVLSLMVMVFAMPVRASGTIEIDPTPLFDSINTWLPTMFGIFAIPIGIAISVVIVLMLGRMLIRAFSSAGGSLG